MDLHSMTEELYEYAKGLRVIDAHDHFISEAEHNSRYLSFNDYLYYVKGDLVSAGAERGRLERPENEATALELFAYMKPFWQYVKNGSYGNTVIMALKHFHGCDDLTEETVVKIGHELNAKNKPGYYDAVFGEAKIDAILNQSDTREKPYPDKRFVYCVPNEFDYGLNIRAFLKDNPEASYDDYMKHIDDTMAENVGFGAKLQKFWTNTFLCEPDYRVAVENFYDMRRNPSMKCGAVLAVTIAHEKIRLCEKHGLVAAVHTGAWGDITRLAPERLFPVVEKHRGTTFDIYHMGAPYVRECAFLGKNYPHVNLNASWGPSVSVEMARSAFNEWLDLVPVNKVFGFGGDLRMLPEHVFANLRMVQKLLAEVFAYRISAGRMDMDYAKFVMKLWMYDNAKRVYRLS